MSSAARGDTRPCIKAGCDGMMQFGRKPLASVAGVAANTGEPGWVCNASPAHFTPTIEP